jgi:hypothetical protein
MAHGSWPCAVEERAAWSRAASTWSGSGWWIPEGEDGAPALGGHRAQRCSLQSARG